MKQHTLFSALLCFAPFCEAGIQTAVVLVNRSPFDVIVDFDIGENCIYTQFGPNNLNHYYDAYVDNSGQYLSAFKQLLGITDLTDSRSGVGGYHTIPAWTDRNVPQFVTFNIQMKGSGDCFGSKSYLDWGMDVNGSTWMHSIIDPPSSPWRLWQEDPSGDQQDITLGEGGYFNTAIFDPILELFGSDTAKGAVSFPTGGPAPVIDFSWFYRSTPSGDRSACILGRDVVGSFECLVTGVALVVTNDGSEIFALPLPNVGRDW